MTIQMPVGSIQEQIALFGNQDDHVKVIENALGVTIDPKEAGIEIIGDNKEAVEKAAETLGALRELFARGDEINRDVVYRLLDMAVAGQSKEALDAMDDVVVITHTGKPIRCKTIGQQGLIRAMKNTDVTICIGPAGTGKTYLAVAEAVAEFKRGEIERIIMSRPAIEAGEERLGFLPGDLSQKVDPYLRPLYDALNDVLGPEQSHRFQEKGIIEIAPLAYMRGRTLSNARIIIDESQNASLPTLKMALTRLGEGSKMILTGDVTQIDLPKASMSGLERVSKILSGLEGISVVHLTNRDVVRNRIVQQIIKAFEKEEAKEAERMKQRPAPAFHKKNDSSTNNR